MRSTAVTATLVALSLSVGGFAAAQDRSRDGGQRDQGNYSPQDRNDHRNPGRGHGARRDGQGAGPDHAFYRGDRLPQNYRGNQYVVDDWRGHNLSAPPRGYHWVQTGGDYVLAAIATGVILQLLLSH